MVTLYEQSICNYACAGLYRPGKPSSPRVVSVARQSVTLEWTAPQTDGGSHISKYILIIDFQVSSRTMYFKKLVKGPRSRCRLFPGRTYQFAVAAKNRAGHGEFSDFSLSFTLPQESGKDFYHVLHVYCMRNIAQ